jgi:signal transduction histidine kinase
MPVPVEVHTNGLERSARFPSELEGAAYFFVSEALANALKHSAAVRIQVRFRSKPGQLVVEVDDDGKGFEPGQVNLSGLLGLEDRIEALGGRIEIASAPGNGTRLRAHLPLDKTDSA